MTDQAHSLGADDTIHLSIGVPSEPLDTQLLLGIADALATAKTTYTTTAGLPELRDRIAETRPRPGTRENVIVTAGAGQGIFLALASLINPGDEVAIVAPSYTMYASDVRLFGGKPVFVPLTPSQRGFFLEPNQLEAAITPKTKLIILNSPHNPTGWVADIDTIRAIVRCVETHDLLLLSDEIYKDYVFDEPFVSPEAFSNRVIVIDGISKSFSATGLRIGWVVADEQIIQALLPLHQLMLFSAPAPGQYATLRLLKTDYQPQLRRLRQTYRRRRNVVLEQLKDVSLFDTAKPSGAFYVFPRLRQGNALDFANQLLHEKHVVVVPGLDYGPEWTDFIRIAYCQPESVLLEACSRIADFARGYEAAHRLPKQAVLA
jgi:aminotransferase